MVGQCRRSHRYQHIRHSKTLLRHGSHLEYSAPTGYKFCLIGTLTTTLTLTTILAPMVELSITQSHQSNSRHTQCYTSTTRRSKSKDPGQHSHRLSAKSAAYSGTGAAAGSAKAKVAIARWISTPWEAACGDRWSRAYWIAYKSWRRRPGKERCGKVHVALRKPCGARHGERYGTVWYITELCGTVRYSTVHAMFCGMACCTLWYRVRYIWQAKNGRKL